MKNISLLNIDNIEIVNHMLIGGGGLKNLIK